MIENKTQEKKEKQAGCRSTLKPDPVDIETLLVSIIALYLPIDRLMGIASLFWRSPDSGLSSVNLTDREASGIYRLLMGIAEEIDSLIREVRNQVETMRKDASMDRGEARIHDDDAECELPLL